MNYEETRKALLAELDGVVHRAETEIRRTIEHHLREFNGLANALEMNAVAVGDFRQEHYRPYEHLESFTQDVLFTRALIKHAEQLRARMTTR